MKAQQRDCWPLWVMNVAHPLQRIYEMGMTRNLMQTHKIGYF